MICTTRNTIQRGHISPLRTEPVRLPDEVIANELDDIGGTVVRSSD